MTKRELLLSLLERDQAFIRLDGRALGVSLPDWLRQDSAVVLQLGYGMAVPIPDLEVDERGFACTLSFRRAPWRCEVPWGAVYAIADSDGHGMVFAEDLPKDVELQDDRAEAAAATTPNEVPAEAAPGKKRARASHLKLVD